MRHKLKYNAEPPGKACLAPRTSCSTAPMIHLPQLAGNGFTVPPTPPGGEAGMRARIDQDRRNSRRSALIVAASVVGMPCGKPWYVFSVPFCTSFADSGPESA